MSNKPVYVVFADKRLEADFEALKTGKFEDKQLYDSITKAINELKKAPIFNIKIPKKLWPKDYTLKYKITNLWKYNLPSGWRLVYTIKTDEIMMLCIILDWFNHKGYEMKFRY